MNKHNFTPNEMEGIGEVLRNAYLAAFLNLGEERQVDVTQFWREHLMTAKPYLMVTEKGVVEASRRIFSNETLLDFMLQFTNNFFMLWGADHNTRVAFVDHVSVGLCNEMGIATGKVSSYTAAHKDVYQRMATVDDVKNVLSRNTWLLVLVISPTYLSFREYDQEKGKKK